MPLTYDEIGNVLQYGDRNFYWQGGRNLAQITDGDNTYSYTYDESGIRTSKTVNGITTYFNTKDGVILSQTDGTNTMYFQYDTNGSPLGFIYDDTQYFYLTNQMGDVILITDAQGNELVQYEYDEWGALGSITTTNNTDEENTLANINPLRYRGYYYDSETGYYYLVSRYYDPSICRFINADAFIFTGFTKEISTGTNIYLYCYNNPTNNIDDTGCLTVTLHSRYLSINRYSQFNWNVTYSVSLKSIAEYLKWKGRLCGVISIAACLVPDATVSKVVGISSGVAGLMCDFASSIISKKAGNKRLYVTFYMKGVIKSSYRYYSIYIPNALKYSYQYKYRAYYITSMGVSFYVK